MVFFKSKFGKITTLQHSFNPILLRVFDQRILHGGRKKCPLSNSCTKSHGNTKLGIWVDVH